MGKWNSKPSPLWKLDEASTKAVVEAYRAGEPAVSVGLRFGITLHAVRYHARKADIWHKGKRPIPLENRFWAKVDKTDGCWNWIGSKFPNGYGCIRIDGISRGAHCVSYEINCGPIPEGLTIDHLCMNKKCVNPKHLEAVTQAENYRRYRASLGTRQ